MQNQTQQRRHQSFLRHFFDVQLEGRTAAEGFAAEISERRTVVDDLKENDASFRELKLSSIHALLDWNVLLEALQQNRTVRSVRIHGFFMEKLTPTHQKLFWEAIGSLPNLKELYINYFLDFWLTEDALSSVLSRACKLTKLSIHDSKISCRGNERELVSLENHISLATVHFSQLYVSCEQSTLDSIIKSTASAPNLRKVIIRMAQQQRHLLSNKSLEELVRKRLTTLELRKIVLDTDNLEYLMRQLQQRQNSEEQTVLLSSTLKELVLECGETLPQKACAAVGSMLQNNHTLERLELWGGRIDESGLLCIAENLKCNRRLRVFHMSHENITKRGRDALVEMLRYNVFLESIVLRTFQEADFLQTVNFFLKMNTTQIRRLLLNVNVNQEQIFDKLVIHSKNLDYLFHLLQRNPLFLVQEQSI